MIKGILALFPPDRIYDLTVFEQDNSFTVAGQTGIVCHHHNSLAKLLIYSAECFYDDLP
ncbi:hypothetical protein [[Clostridium] hylemonae]|uniref:hypothetical protein n=1 Tax=[Clostridium] hylemonae TaxID=89153 RepID=UPI003A7F2503